MKSMTGYGGAKSLEAPYKLSVEVKSVNGRFLDVNAEIELWTRAGHIKIKLGKGADVRRIDQLIAWAVLNSH